MDHTRKIWLDAMLKIAQPVLTNLDQGTLKQNLPVTFHPDRTQYTHLEALGRTLCGLAPWLELDGIDEEERKLQTRFRRLARSAVANAVDPSSPDYMNFTEGYGQSLVDAAFLAHGIVRAPQQLYTLLDPQTKENLSQALRATRKFTPFVSNWICFSAMIEAALFRMGQADYDLTRVDYAVNMFKKWYVGDGLYSDGEFYHWDYYNSFVIHPMLIDILRIFSPIRQEYGKYLEECLKRGGRYAEILERMINSDGSYPIVGRSVTYRFGAFQLLSQAALQDFLPGHLPAAQVRCALTAVITKVMENRGMFDAEGWLTPGVYGLQPGLAEGYISTGSLYLCESVFLALGLSPEHRFWSDPDTDWTAKKLWSGQDTAFDHAVD